MGVKREQVRIQFANSDALLRSRKKLVTEKCMIRYEEKFVSVILSAFRTMPEEVIQAHAIFSTIAPDSLSTNGHR